MNTVDAYIENLDARLVGPRKAKTDLMREVRDHLTDSCDAYRRAGFGHTDAETRAVEEFGDAAVIASDYQSELALAQSRRTALTMFAVLLVQPLVWQDWLPGFEEGTSGLGTAVTVVDALVELLGAASIVGAALCVLACGVGTRFVAARSKLVRVTAFYALATCLVLPALGVVLGSQAPSGTAAVLGSLGWVVAFLVLPLSVVARSAVRSLRVA